MLRHPLTNFELQKYYKNEPKFSGVNLRNNLYKIKDGAYMTNLDEYESIQTHWSAFYVNDSNATFFDRFAVEHIPREIKKLIENENIITNIYRAQAYDSIIQDKIMCEY